MFRPTIFFVILSLVYVIQSNPVDLETASSNDDHHGGRVQIKVFRGPTEHDGHHHYAPWGYWVKQPADEEKHYK